MPFPAKFKDLLELRDCDVAPPRHVCLVYAVCGRETHSCGWHGWTLSGAWLDPGPGVRDPCDPLVPGAYDAPCPRCGRALVPVDAEAWFSAAQRPWPEVECEVVPMEYVEDPDQLLAEKYIPLSLARIRWRDRKPEADKDHEHCEVCFARISDAPYDQHEAMSDRLHRWICLACWRRIESASRS